MQPRLQYALSGVVALRAAAAFACGGNPQARMLAGAGVVLGTADGGRRWSMQALPAFSYAAADGTAVSGSAAEGTLPMLNAIAAAGTVLWAVGDYGLVVTAPVSAANSTPPVWTVVTVLGAGAPAAAALYGIAWDGLRAGYVYGNGVIYSTRDSGASWQLNQIPPP